MSIPIASTTEWFRCIRGTPAEHRAALFRLVRMLCGDDRRPRPPVSLPGRPAAAAAPPAQVLPKLRSYRQALPQGKAINSPSRDGDAREPYSRRRLQRMNRSFVERLERAIARGQEQPHAC